MKIGYPCINLSIGCLASSTFRLRNFSKERFFDTVDMNLQCLQKILEYNISHQILFFRISSNIIPFASHPICKINWLQHYQSELKQVGQFIKKHQIRISMHPSQFILINTLRSNIVKNSIKELEWHCQLLDAMHLPQTAKVQIHVGGVYADKMASISRFINQYTKLPAIIKKRLVIENDDRLFSVSDCLQIYKRIKIPIVLDIFHHECLNNNEKLHDVFSLVNKTWQKLDGLPMIDYSSQHPEGRRGKHADQLNKEHFANFIKNTQNFNYDIMLEIKNKEKSALQALEIAKKLRQLS